MGNSRGVVVVVEVPKAGGGVRLFLGAGARVCVFAGVPIDGLCDVVGLVESDSTIRYEILVLDGAWYRGFEPDASGRLFVEYGCVGELVEAFRRRGSVATAEQILRAVAAVDVETIIRLVPVGGV